MSEIKKNLTDDALSSLRASLPEEMSEKRYVHTVEVEKMARRLGELYAPEKISVLCAAALLHDITKEWRDEEHVEFLAARGVSLSECELLSPKTFHARSAALVISEKYPELADSEVISAVRWHTTGRADMTLTEKLIYLADYIDMSRKFEDCVRLREYFFAAQPEKMNMEERLLHLDKTLVLSFDMTIKGLLESGSVISTETAEARNDLVRRLKK